MASSASKAVEAATAFMNGEAEEQASKRPRVFPPGPSVAAGSQDVLLTQLLRSHLVQTNAVLEATNATQLVLLVKEEDDKKFLLGLLSAWHQKQREISLTPGRREQGNSRNLTNMGLAKSFSTKRC